ncbi:MAG: type secretion system protein GspH [Pseudomonadota bacterium]|jgi:general secretion pathway protein H
MRSAGFTLIELMVVLAVVGLLAGVTVPQMGPAMAAARIKSSGRDVASALRHTRALAISQHRPCQFFLDMRQHVYQLCDGRKRYALPSALEIKLDTASTLLVSDHQGSIEFYPDGSSSGGRVTIRYGQRGVQLDVNWLTGMVTETEVTGAGKAN